MADKPSVLFVCVHNAGRSQMAAGFLTHLSGGEVEVRSAGSLPGDQVNPSAVAAMAEVGIDISEQPPKVLTTDAVQASDVVITMGCGDACPIFPGKRYLDWELEDPAGKGVEAVRPIRDEIKARVQALLVELLPEQSPTPRPLADHRQRQRPTTPRRDHEDTRGHPRDGPPAVRRGRNPIGCRGPSAGPRVGGLVLRRRLRGDDR